MDVNPQVIPERQLMLDEGLVSKEGEVEKVIRRMLITYTVISLWAKWNCLWVKCLRVKGTVEFRALRQWLQISHQTLFLKRAGEGA